MQGGKSKETEGREIFNDGCGLGHLREWERGSSQELSARISCEVRQLLLRLGCKKLADEIGLSRPPVCVGIGVQKEPKEFRENQRLKCCNCAG